MAYRLLVGAALCLLSVLPVASQAQTIAFIDEGSPATVVLDNSTVRVRVVDPAADVAAGRDSVMATVTSDLAGDSASLSLLETGPGTGVFEGVIDLEPGGSIAAPTLATAISQGPPPTRDTLHATYGSATATAGLVESTIRFLDDWGRVGTTFAAGHEMRLRVRDEIRNFHLGRDYLVVHVTSQSGDSEYITLWETSMNSGVFEGVVGTTRAPGSSGNGELNLAVSDVVTATLFDEDGLDPSIAQVQIAESVVVLLDGDGNPAADFVESGPVHMMVIAPDFTGGALNVQVTASLTGDSETVSLQGVDGGAFAGEIASILAFGSVIPGDGVLQIAEVWGPPMLLDTVTVSYTGGYGTASASAPFIRGRLTFLDAHGAETSSIAAGTEARIRLEYHGDDNSGRLDLATVRLVNDDSGEEEYVQLTETGHSTGVFIGSMPLTANGPTQWFNQTLNAEPGEQLRANHGDISEPVAVITDLSLEFLDERGEPTDAIVESGTARVRMWSVASNTSPTSPDTAPVEMRVLLSNDLEMLTLTETGPDTNVFEGSMALEMGSFGDPDGVLQTANSGMPDYRPDEIMARSGAVEATARTIGARIEFVDASGRKVSSYVAGEIARLRIIDHFRSFYGNVFPVTLRSSVIGDSETVMMRETSPDSGVFEGSIPTERFSMVGIDGRVAVDLLDEIEVRHTTGFSPIELTARAEIRASSVVFLDAAGQPTTVYLESSRAYVRVVSAAANTSSAFVESVSVEVASVLGPDVETMTLIETGQNTGVFEGSMPMRLSFSGVQPGNGMLETLEAGHAVYDPPHEFDTLRVTYNGAEGAAVAMASLTGSRTWFGNAAGDEVLSYVAGGTAYIWVEDQNRNEAGLWNDALVRVRSLTTGDQEDLLLLETTRDSGIFIRALPLESSPAGQWGDGRLQTQAGEQIEVVHQDVYGATYSSAVAGIDALGLEFFDETGEPTGELLAAGEARVRMFSLGNNSNPGMAETVSVTVQSLRSGDQEFLMLTETGPDTGVFEGSIPMAVGSGNPNNGTLQTRNSGSPGYLPDEVTARSGPYSATARVAGARLIFFDIHGREVSSYAAGEDVQVRVVDYTRRSTVAQGNVTVSFVSRDGSDSETTYPYETGLGTGVFEGSVGTQLSSYASLGDMSLRVIPEDQVEARYQTIDDPNPIEATVAVTGHSVRFVDAAGQPASVYLESSRAYVQVVSFSSNTSMWMAEAVSVQVVSELGPDTETLTLIETGLNTGVFAGSIPMRLSLSGVVAGNGLLETIETGSPNGFPPHEFDTLRATFSNGLGTSVARISLTGSRTWFADAIGQEALAFAAGSTAFIRVEDQNRNELGQWNDVEVRVRSLTTGDQEDLIVTETTRDSGIFAIALPLERSSIVAIGDGRLQVQPGEQIEVVHQDFYGATYSSAIADITEASLEFIDGAGEPTAELLESGDARLRMFSSGGNANPGTIETLAVDVQSLRSGDQETVTLAETGPDTSVFEGSIPMAVGPGSSGNGVLETRNSGDPAYLPDVVTARSGTSLATAQVADARLLFIDAYGRAAASYAAGETVGVRVVDHNRNYSAQTRETLQVYLASRDLVDGEPLTLQETGIDTGAFEGTLPTVASGPANVSNGELRVDLDDEIEVRHSLAHNPNGLVAQAAITGNAVLFIDTAGRPATVYLESSRAYVRVVSASGNASPAADSVTVQLMSELSPDLETLTLIETGPNTAVFEGSIPMRLSTSGVQQGNGMLETVEFGHPVNQPPHELDTLRATFTDASGTSVARIGLAGSRTWFTNAAGEVVTSYPWFGTAYIRIEDQNRNDPGQWDRVQVQLRSESQLGSQFGGDQESLELLETTRDSGIFTGSIRLSHNDLPTAGDGLLGADPGDPIEASHQDFYGATFSTAHAVIAAAGVEFFDETGAATHVLLESGLARVRVFSRLSNTTVSTDSVTVQVRSLWSGDLESLVLTETGGNTSLFEGSLPMSVGPAQGGNGVLQTLSGGSSEYIPDQVTASFSSVYGDASATAETVGARLTFIDAHGREVSSFAAGETIRVRVVDHNRNSPEIQNSIPLYVSSRDTNDGEVLMVQETGYDTAVFEGALPAIVGGSPVSDGQLGVLPGDQIEARHTVSYSSGNIEARAAITGNAVRFIDAAGGPATVYLESSRAHVQVVSASANTDPLSPNMVTVQLRSELGPDLETLTLIETGPSTSVFEGSIPMRLSLAGAFHGNGTLETIESGHPINQPPHEFDTLRATYTDAGGTSVAQIGLIGSRTSFINAAGQEVSAFAVGGSAWIRVEDHNWNAPGIDSVQVRVRSLTSADQEDLMLQETSASSGIFVGSLSLTVSISPSLGQLRVQPGEQIEASHQDYYGATSSTALADVQATAAEFIDEAGLPTGELLESGTARVRMLSVYDNSSPSVPDTVTIQLQSQRSGDSEPVTLTETGADTNVFEGSIAMRYGPGSSDGFLQTQNSGYPQYLADEVSTSDGSARATVVPSRLVFLNMRGQQVSTYALGSPVRVRLIDHNRNFDPEQVNEAWTTLISLVSNDTEGVELTETGPNTGVFEGAIPTAETGPFTYDGLLVAPPGLVEASSYNAQAPLLTTRQATFLTSHAPVAAEDTATTVEDNAVVIPVLANDTGDGPLTVLSVTQPANGSAVVNPDGTVTYTPAAAYYGSDSFTYVIVDAQDIEGMGTVSVTVESGNLAPVANPDTATTPEDQTVIFSILGNDTDPNNDPLVVISVSPAVPTGSALVSTHNWMATYIPTANFNGQVTFEYTVRDPEGLTASTTVTVTVTPVNDAPVAVANAATVPEDGSVTINVLGNDTDVDNDTLSVTAVTQGANGSASINPDKTVTYTPNANFSGTDSFTYTISDGNGGTATATVTVTVTGVNDAPVANDDTTTTGEDNAVSITVLGNDTDPENNTLNVTAVTQGTNGSVTINPDKTVTYTPNANFSGTDSFTYTISDGNGGTDTATVTVTVTGTNDAPVANDDTATVAEDETVSIAALGNDTDAENDALDVTAVTQGTNGSVVINPDETVAYTPNANFSGTDTFTYTISDGNGGTDTATVTVTVTGANDAPVAGDDSATTAEDTAVTVTVLANDSDLDNDTLDVVSVTQGTNGTVTPNANDTITYTPALNFHGTDTFTYTVSDGNGGSDTATVTITVTSVNDAPVASDDTALVNEDGTVAVPVLANDDDADDDTLTVVSVTQGAHGAVVINPDRTVRYTPAANYNGTDSFTYTIEDGNGGSDTATVTVTIGSDNDAPVAGDDSATTAEDTAVTVTVLANDSDLDNDALDVVSVTQGTNGTVTLNANETITYTPALNFHGTDTFTYTVSDSNGGSDTATVTITVTSVNDAPVANADTALVAEDGTVAVTVLANDADADNDTLNVTSVTQGAHGAVVINANQTVTYTPVANYNGGDSFTYSISDGNGGSATATVTVTVDSVNDGPTANADPAAVAEDGSVAVTVLANDSDPENNPLTVVSVTQGAHGSVTINANNTVTYVPAAHYNGGDAFTYTISDGNGGTATATVTVTITAVNDAPVAVNDTATTLAETLVDISVLGNDADIDGPSLSVQSVTQPAHGTVSVNANQTLRYTPASGYSGADSFTYTVTDGAGGTATATVNLTVNAPPRVTTNLQALYELEEGSGTTVTDTSGVGTPLNLTIGSAAAVSWISGGLQINSATLIQSAGAATKVITASQSTNAITLEAWINPLNTSQIGPIATVSQQSNKLNAAIGQSGNRWDGKLRTTSTNQAGSTLSSAVGTATLNLTHVVYTRDASGNVRIYVNGVQSASSTLAGNFSSWTSNYKLGLVNELSSGSPWRGKLYLVAIYNRALSASEARQNWLAGE